MQANLKDPADAAAANQLLESVKVASDDLSGLGLPTKVASMAPALALFAGLALLEERKRENVVADFL